jgi:hypothetical protein
MRAVFSCSAWVVVPWGLFVVYAFLVWQPGEQHTWPNPPLAFLILGIILLLLSAFAFIVLIFGMATFCIVFDPSLTGAKILWFVLFFFTAPVGSAIYFFTVYRRLAPIQSEVINA